MLVLHVGFRIHAESTESFVAATRLYQQRTRTEIGNVRTELLSRRDDSSAFLLLELYRDEAALASHRDRDYTQRWLVQLNESVDGTSQVEHLEMVSKEPPVPPSRVVSGGEYATSASWPSQATHNKRVLAHPPPLPVQQVGHTRAVHLQLRLSKIEIGAAYDGVLHRKPEPCLLVGAYALVQDRIYDIGRALYRFPADGEPPYELSREHTLLDVPVAADGSRVRLILLALGIEENGGSDIRALYQDLAEPDCFRLWRQQDLVPNPQGIAEVATLEDPCWTQAQRVELLRESSLLASALHDDRWVGAALACPHFPKLEHSVELRFRLVSEDRLNDWVALISASLC